ncbi:multidrug efflux SMR transporter [Ferrimonas balearica]|uniref:DMT family transporter n=1 Tax=Ferrimonas balearica TaxID=44012 RepID=UPI001C59DD1A|nr:multidrug efflux SMR transporter [Ferrimonas balearica]MBW3139311.1 multidrug efflux SMR transporter [Ferrimonas balearica]
MKTKWVCWGFLTLAIVTEVAGTSMMSVFSEDNWLKYLMLYAFIGTSYYFLAKAAKRIPIGIAYALWEGFGISLIALVGIFWLGQIPSLLTAIGLMLAIVGIVMVTLGEEQSEASASC